MARRTHTKLKGAPDYDDAEFWDTRFATGGDVGEWLNSGEALLEAVLADLENRPSVTTGKIPRVLHLGPGVSKLGCTLRDKCVEREWQGSGIVNADFSTEAVRIGREFERTKNPMHAMQWLRADLRLWNEVSVLGEFAPFDVILDKSTSDAISTSGDFEISSEEELLACCPIVIDVLSQNPGAALSPVEHLGLQLVPLTQKGSTWIVLSYSNMRFDGLSFMAAYWTIRSRIALKAPAGPLSSTHTPDVFHWLYILERK